MPASPPIVNVGFRSTNFWVIGGGDSRLLLDLGWPGMFSSLEAQCRKMDVPLRSLRAGIATHYHMDHAGSAQELRNAGMQLVVTPEQEPYLDDIIQYIKPGETYLPIVKSGYELVACGAESRAYLAKLGLSGELVHTPGHSDDSVSLVLDSGECFTGDLTHPNFAGEAELAVVTASWDRLRSLGATRVYPGHGPVRSL